MKILIICSTFFEIKAFIEFINAKEIGKKIFFGKYCNCNFSVLVCGIGVINTAYYLTKKMNSEKFDLILNVGICGTYNRNFQIGDVVSIQTEQFADLGVDDNGTFRTIFDISIADKNEFPFENGIMINKSEIQQNYLIKKMKTANSITINTASGEEKSITKIIEKFNPDVESMEGAAFFFVCKSENINFAEIRSVSNYVEPRNKSNWNIDLAVNNLNDFLIKFSENL